MTPQAATETIGHPSSGYRRASDQRSEHRYVLTTPMIGALEHTFERHEGRVLNLSRQGFLLHLPGLDPQALAADGQDDFGEILCGVRSFGGFGRIVHIKPREDGTEIGFHWDPYVLERRDAAVDELIGQLVDGAAGQVRIEAGRVALSGHVSAALASDVFGAYRAGATVVSLAECTSIESSGLDLLAQLARLGLDLVDLGTEVGSMIQNRAVAARLS